MNSQPLKCAKGHEQEGRRPAVIVGVPLGDVRYSVVVVVPLTTQFGAWGKRNPVLYPIIRIRSISRGKSTY